MTDKLKLRITTSPHLHHKDSTSRIMWSVAAALLPAAIWGISVFGYYSAFILVLSIISAVGSEYLINLFSGKSTLHDGSAFVTGLLIGMNMPPLVPLGIPIVASIFAILVVKWTFGGLGRNWMNPALAGRVFVFFSWTGGMNAWKSPSTLSVDGLSGATPLGAVKSALLDPSRLADGPIEVLRQIGMVSSTVDQRIIDWLNSFGFQIQYGYIDLLVGNIGGCIGEVSGILLILGGIFLLTKNYANWRIVASYGVSFSLFIYIFGGLPFTHHLFSGDVFFHLFSGGLLLGLFFMSTDMVSSPVTPKGMIIYGACTGFLTFLIRIYGSFPEGVSLAILLMNIVSPLIDRLGRPRIFGTGQRQEGIG